MGWYQPHIPETPQGTDLTGQTIVVTGATGGLGYESSLQLLRLKASTIILGVRSTKRGNDARQSLLADDEVQRVNPQAKVKVLQLNLADERSVVEFANRVLKEESRLDVLLLNAGINLARWEQSPSGHEMLMQVNYLSNALLSLVLLPLLEKTSQSIRSSDPSSKRIPKITWVGSLAQGFNSLGKFPVRTTSHVLPYFDSYKDYSRFSRYPDSKFLVAMFVREMAKHIPSASNQAKNGPVTINNLCPGTVNTAADNNLPFYMRMPMNLNRKLRSRTVEEGARALVYAAVVADDKSHGKYISSNEISPLAPYADTEDGKLFAEKLWTETVDLCTRIDGKASDGLLK